MPELPEVETIVRELQEALPGEQIHTAHLWPKQRAVKPAQREAFLHGLPGSSFAQITRRGKYLCFALRPHSSPQRACNQEKAQCTPRFLVAHLRMTGKFVLVPRDEATTLAGSLPTNPLTNPPTSTHHRLGFVLKSGRALIFQDMRQFGTLDLVPRLEDHPALCRLGPEPLSSRFSLAVLRQRSANSRREIKSWLLDQTQIAGLGNIYAAEALFRAGIHPQRRCCSLTSAETHRLHRQIRGVLREAIRHNGTTIADFARIDSKTGDFQKLLRVYGKSGQPCSRCGRLIVRTVQQQRSTYFCPRCQF